MWERVEMTAAQSIDNNRAHPSELFRSCKMMMKTMMAMTMLMLIFTA
jgi:hypothetical protein